MLTMLASIAQAQSQLSGSRRTGVYDYLYRLSDKEAINITQNGINIVDSSFLHTLSDSILHEEQLPPGIAPGNYLRVYAETNKLHAVMTPVMNINAGTIHNAHDLIVVLHDTRGNPVSDAIVKAGTHTLSYIPSASSWWTNKYRKKGVLEVYYKGVLNCFTINAAPSYNKAPFYKRLFAPLRSHKQPYGHRYSEYGSDETRYEKKCSGYMAFSKPRYKPGDTVKLKAFIFNQKKKPFNTPLLLRLVSKGYDDVDTILTTVRPYRPGAYEYQFVLSPDLDIDLDDDYYITLETLKSRRYDLNTYEGDMNDDDYLSQRQVAIRGKFAIEEYELHNIKFNARTDHAEHFRNEPVALYFSATDENELPVMDGRIRLLALSRRAGNIYDNHVFIPDTLWKSEIALEPTGETKLILPDSIFPKADLSYKVECLLFTSSNEMYTASLQQQYNYEKDPLSITQREDSLFISYEGTATHERSAMLYSMNADYRFCDSARITLPYRAKINPYHSGYTVNIGALSRSYTIEALSDAVAVIPTWSKDTTFINAKSNYNIPFWYTIFNKQKLIAQGYTNDLTWTGSTTHKEEYELRYSYMWGGKMTDEYRITGDPGKILRISVNAPKEIYPGQTAKITISVKDKYLHPLENIDVTAYANTAKFQTGTEPQYTRQYPRPFWRKYGPKMSVEPMGKMQQQLTLDWQLYSKKMGLDSLLYFRFTHPDPIFIHIEENPDYITQFAPFVFAKGNIQPVHILYLDEVPVYSSMASPIQPYSLPITPGRHKVRMRTQYQEIAFDTIFKYGVKTFISIDSAINHSRIRVTQMPPELTPAELTSISRYMIGLENTFRQQPAYIQETNKIYDLNNSTSDYFNSGPLFTVGPLTGKSVRLVVKDQFTQNFTPEPGYNFNISQELIKQRCAPVPAHYKFLKVFHPDTSLASLVLTQAALDRRIQANEEEALRNRDVTAYGTPFDNDSKLILKIAHHALPTPDDILQYLFLRYDDPSFLRTFSGKTTTFENLDTGYYKIAVILRNNLYFPIDSVLLKANTSHYIKLDSIPFNYQDGEIRFMLKKLKRLLAPGVTPIEMVTLPGTIAENYNQNSADQPLLTRTITGFVKDGKGAPLPGVTVALKGTRSGTTTDGNGFFRLQVSPKGTLKVMYIGFATQEQRLTTDDFYLITLTEDVSLLSEVVVTAYNTNFQKALYGKAAGVRILTAPRFSETDFKEDVATDSLKQPLLIVNGLPFDGLLSDIPAASIKSIDVLKSKEATAIYGARAVNGVMLIVTGKQEDEQAAGHTATLENSIRRNFRDDAFWQPKLRTDAQGNASFTVTFPDDITSWNAYAVAMSEKNQMAMKDIKIRSFKMISANLQLPAFATEGDSMNIIGKGLNYTSDSVTVTRTISINDSVCKTGTAGFRNSLIDIIPLKAGSNDSLHIRYIINREGYTDGEIRSIPIVRRGVEETIGTFAALYNDTTFTYTPAAATSLNVRAETAVLPVLMDELSKVQHYKYLCNEQLASKLKAYLLEKKIYVYLKKDFDKDKDIRNIIHQLNQQKTEGLWGWWDRSPVSLWITKHVLEALLMAEEQGYKTDFEKRPAIDYFVHQLHFSKGIDTISTVQLLADLGASINYRGFIDSLQWHRSGHDMLRIIAIQQQVGMRVDLTPVLNRSQQTVFGNIFWGKDTLRLLDNSIHETLLAYKILRKAGGYEDMLQKIRGYFLEQRKQGQWRNTYESSSILEAILPDVMKDAAEGSPVFTINGQKISHFPYVDTLNTNKLNISKQGKLPVYFTAWQQHFNPAPEKYTGLFNVTTTFRDDRTVIKELKSGTPITLQVEVYAKKDADYVLVEIPIPSGCSYKSKSQEYDNYEVHREHFKDRVSIFCSKLTAGKHTFTVELLPRYTGVYQLNPAKAEMQYFPVFTGREALKEINIQ